MLFAGLLLAPVVIVLHYAADLSATAEFVIAATALIPLAWLIGEATEHAAEHTGPGIGGFLNATFGNAPELIIALIAVNQGLTEVVRGSLTGSVVGNLLLVLGFSLLAGGNGTIDRWSSFMSFAAIGIAIVLFLIPSVPSWTGDPDRDAIVTLTVPVSIALLVLCPDVPDGARREPLNLLHALPMATTQEAKPPSTVPPPPKPPSRKPPPSPKPTNKTLKAITEPA